MPQHKIVEKQHITERPPSPSAMPAAEFRRREEKRRALFSQTWVQKVPRAFNDVPRFYRLGNAIASLGLWELWMWQFINTIKLRPEDKILDVCAGTNFIGIQILKKQPRALITAIDRSEAMQAWGRKDAVKLGFHIESVIRDVHELPFPDNCFDVVTINAASRHLQLDKVVPEIFRVLKPGGHFYHCDMLKPANNIIKRLYLRYLGMILRLTAMIVGASKDSRDCTTYFTEAIDNFYTAKELSGIMELVGFAPVVCKKSVWCGMVGFHDAQKPL